MKALEIHLKSGNAFIVDATAMTTKRGQVDGELTSLEWTTPKGGKRKLHYINLDIIAALVVIS